MLLALLPLFQSASHAVPEKHVQKLARKLHRHGNVQFSNKAIRSFVLADRIPASVLTVSIPTVSKRLQVSTKRLLIQIASFKATSQKKNMRKKKDICKLACHLSTTVPSMLMAATVLVITYFSTMRPMAGTRTVTSPVIVWRQVSGPSSLMITTLCMLTWTTHAPGFSVTLSRIPLCQRQCYATVSIILVKRIPCCHLAGHKGAWKQILPPWPSSKAVLVTFEAHAGLLIGLIPLLEGISAKNPHGGIFSHQQPFMTAALRL